MMSRQVGIATRLLFLAPLAACAERAPEHGPGGGLSVRVEPLTLPSVVNACYSLEVKNEVGERVWFEPALCADRFGDNVSDISYVGPCDATDGSDPDTVATNTVILKINALYAADNTVLPADADTLPDVLGEWKNPCAAPYNPNGCQKSVICNENSDSPVKFDLTIMREANQGFFDIAVDFDDIFCSAKVDCRYQSPDRAIELVFHPVTGERLQSVVWALACTDGNPPGTVPQSTHLYMSELVMTCGGTDYIVKPSEGPGNLYPLGVAPPAGPIAQAMVFEGKELLLNGTLSADKLYWSVALGLNPAFFVATAPACTLRVRATATEGPLAGGTIGGGDVYPYIDVVVPVSAAGGALTCTNHPLGGNQVTPSYTHTTGGSVVFPHEGQPAGTPSGINTHEIDVNRCLDVICTPSDSCHVSACVPTTGFCREAPKNCNDSNVCTTDACNASTEAGCTHVAVVCNDGDDCTVDACVAPATGCVYTPGNPGQACSVAAGAGGDCRHHGFCGAGFGANMPPYDEWELGTCGPDLCATGFVDGSTLGVYDGDADGPESLLSEEIPDCVHSADIPICFGTGCYAWGGLTPAACDDICDAGPYAVIDHTLQARYLRGYQDGLYLGYNDAFYSEDDPDHVCPLPE